jgi:hypothetical protein
MSSDKQDTQGYEPGKGRTYTPSLEVTWIKDFNNLLNERNINRRTSRNELTSELIHYGLQYLKNMDVDNEPIVISSNEYTEEQLEILKSETGQRIIKNIINAAIFGSSLNLDLSNKPPVIMDKNESSTPVITTRDGIVPAEKEIIDELPKQENPDLLGKAFSKLEKMSL